MSHYLTGPCVCCHRSSAIFGPTRVPDGLPDNGAPAVCGRCTRHLGDHPVLVKRREREHFELWAEDAREAAEGAADRCAAVVAEMQAQIDSLRTELAARPTRVADRNLDQEAVDQAFVDRKRAYDARDQAFRVLAAVHMLHHDIGGEKCACGAALPQCRAADLVDSCRALKGWECKQWERKRDGLPPLLPAGHPGVLDYHWEPDEDALDAATLFDDSPAPAPGNHGVPLQRAEDVPPTIA